MWRGNGELKEACQCLRTARCRCGRPNPVSELLEMGSASNTGLFVSERHWPSGQGPLPRHLTPDTRTPCLNSQDQAFSGRELMLRHGRRGLGSTNNPVMKMY